MIVYGHANQVRLHRPQFFYSPAIRIAENPLPINRTDDLPTVIDAKGPKIATIMRLVASNVAPAEMGGGLNSRWVAKDESEPEGKRLSVFKRGSFVARYTQSEEDAKLLDLAGEVAQELAQKK